MADEFTREERAALAPYFTNLDGPVFALVNLPEVVKGALFARYSRSSKSLRRLFLDEFVGDLDLTGDLTVDATVGLRRAEELYDRVFFEYGDDSVAQLGGVHLACEQASNLLTKILEWGRLMAYLEQSTRYIPYDSRLGGRYRYWRDPEIARSPLGARYVADLDVLFDTYAGVLPDLMDWAPARYPRSSSPTSIPTARRSSSPRCATRTRTCPRIRSGRGCGASRPTSGWRCCARTSESGRTGATSPAGPSSAPTTGSTSCATTGPSGTSSGTGC